MESILWRAVVNALTKPRSYSVQIVPRNISGYDKMATDISAEHPNYDADMLRAVAPLIMEWIQRELISGNWVTFKDAFNFRLTCSGRLAGPDDPLPDGSAHLHTRVFPSRKFNELIRMLARLRQLAMDEKLPQITSSEDTKLKLADVLNPDGVLRLTGTDLFFDEEDPDCSCTIAGTESGETKQTTFASISNTEVLLVPDIPAQANPWNNEYQVGITTQYTEHGTPREGFYRRRLRTPLRIPGMGQPNPPETGILTDNHPTPYVGINGGSVAADERLRIQVIYDPVEDGLLFNLIDMKEGGAAGAEVLVTQPGEYILPGFAGSAVSTLEITVDDYDNLKAMVHDYYSSRLVDVLDVSLT